MFILVPHGLMMSSRIRISDERNSEYAISKEGWVRRIFGSCDGVPGW